VLQSILLRRGLEASQVAYLGDDLHDLPVLRRVGLAACPMDAAPEVQAACHWTVPLRGGEGVFRAVAECVLKAQGLWEGVLARYE
jgi:3-deoxy-D-manno-octulosonate 8-phosphate phosphatase (KDO 8-P phosphatase)